MNFKFYLQPPTNIPTMAAYEHGAVCIAEGLKELGFTFYANTFQWFDNEQGDYLFKPSPLGFNPDVCVYSASYFIMNIGKMEDVDFKKYNILLDLEDGYPTLANNDFFSKFNLILRTHYSSEYTYNKNVAPWAFGVSNRIINELDKTYDEEDNNDVYVNYRVGFNIRSLSILEMLPILAKKYNINHSVTDNIDIKEIKNLDVNHYWIQTGRRHNEDYYKLLNESLITLTFCGALEKKEPILFHRLKEAIESRINFRISRNFKVANFDSWRFWESLYAYTCPIHLDFDYWNLVFPVQPIEGKHYIGVKNMDFKEVAEKVNSLNKQTIRDIGYAGKRFVSKNYKPKPTAIRLLNYIK